jgi:hypothetical protein
MTTAASPEPASIDHRPLRGICNEQLLGSVLSGFQFK